MTRKKPSGAGEYAEFRLVVMGMLPLAFLLCREGNLRNIVRPGLRREAMIGPLIFLLLCHGDMLHEQFKSQQRPIAANPSAI